MTKIAINKQTQWRSYKPTKEGKGAASKLEMRAVEEEITKNDKTFTKRKVLIFWTTAQQIGIDKDGNAEFAWKDETKYVTLKLGEADLGEILSCLNGRKKVAGTEEGNYKGLFHKNDTGSTTFLLERGEKAFSIRVTKKVGQNDALAIRHMLTFGEAEILKILFEEAVQFIYLWS